jgi:hypothetical protein
LERIVAVGNKAFAQVPDGAAVGDGTQLLGVQHPAEIENYRTIGVPQPTVPALSIVIVATARVLR